MPFGALRDRTRLVAFSDGVIAIAVTLLVLGIRHRMTASTCSMV
jgi:uncharacterized membrane protein